jgi:hypothetical protein
MFRFCKREKPSTKTRITLIDTLILINKELSTFTLTVSRCIGQINKDVSIAKKNQRKIMRAKERDRHDILGQGNQ